MTGLPTRYDVPPPVLLNRWKHHAGAIRAAIAHAVQTRGDGALPHLAAATVVVGNDLMDLYTGPDTPAELAVAVLETLRRAGTHTPEAFAADLAANGGYRVIDAPDGSRWTLRQGHADDRFVHLHPGRWSPKTMRVRANVLKTAILAHADALLTGGDPAELARVNRVRREFLGLAPVEAVAAGEGLGLALRALA